MARRTSIRASDADRESVAERLRRAGGEGRLRTDELESRIGSALSAITYGELDVLTADLPRHDSPHNSARSRRNRRIPRGLALLIGVPLAALAAAIVIAVLAGLFASWGVWLLVGWLAFGRARRRRFELHRARAGCWPPYHGPL
ncbi:MAG: DUF1707 SHOCT-like domain-containing protein, partial [Solirubrobacteraceae bacterium]